MCLLRIWQYYNHLFKKKDDISKSFLFIARTKRGEQTFRRRLGVAVDMPNKAPLTLKEINIRLYLMFILFLNTLRSTYSDIFF